MSKLPLKVQRERIFAIFLFIALGGLQRLSLDDINETLAQAALVRELGRTKSPPKTSVILPDSTSSGFTKFPAPFSMAANSKFFVLASPYSAYLIQARIHFR